LNLRVKSFSAQAAAALQQFLYVGKPLEGGRGPQCPSSPTRASFYISSTMKHRLELAF